MTKQLNKKGTSLVELIAVIVIMGIIAGIAIPTTIAVINRQKKNAAYKSAENIVAAAKNVLLEASANPRSALITNVATTGVVKTAGTGTNPDTFEVNSAALLVLGELEKDPVESGTLTVKLTAATGETGTQTFTITCDSVKINGVEITADNINADC